MVYNASHRSHPFLLPLQKGMYLKNAVLDGINPGFQYYTLAKLPLGFILHSAISALLDAENPVKIGIFTGLHTFTTSSRRALAAHWNHYHSVSRVFLTGQMGTML